ncbi:MAG: uroporphyrinogen-III C-methyltransferase [Candidatus Kapaibacterium sp.]
MLKSGKVYLVGAGPGDPGLITVKGLMTLRKAEILYYDKLANDLFMDEVPEGAEKVFVGKEAGRHYVKQEDTIQMMIRSANEGKTVVRLKGGDPMIFGRGSEEAEALKKEGIEFEIIPGITAGVGAAAYAGIPLTHRNRVTQTVFITAHESQGKTIGQVEWEKLSQLRNTTLVIYMGVGRIKEVVKTLLNRGMAKDMPAAIIENATLPKQRVFKTQVNRISDIMEENNVKAPCIFIIGPNIKYMDGLEWFGHGPLNGRRVVVTRAKDQARLLIDRLNELGAEVIHLPVIRTSVYGNIDNFDELKAREFDWVVFTSENGVRYFFAHLEKAGLDARFFANSKIAAIGSGTAAMLRNYRINADFIPKVFTSKEMISEMKELFDISGQKFLRVKGWIQSDILTEELIKAGADTTALQVYDLAAEQPPEDQKNNLIRNGADAVIFTSSSTVNNFYEIMGSNAGDILSRAFAAAIGPVTEETLREKNAGKIITADEHTIDGILKLLLEKL